MREIVTGLLAALILTSAAVAKAQPAGTDEVPPTGGAPAAPAAPGTPPAAPLVAAAPAAPAVTYAVGTRIRGLFVPTWFLEAFMTHAHSLNSFMWGVDFTRHKGNLDMVVGMDVGWYGNFKAANWTGNDGDTDIQRYATDTYWTEFKGFVFTSFDINWIWNHDFTNWLTLRLGGGVGVGFLAGEYYKTLSGPGCTQFNVDSNSTDCAKLPTAPREKENLKYYRVLPVVSALAGFRFNLHRHFVATIEGGFHNGFFCGAGGQYVF